jgi:hypothetical protein
MAENLKSLTDWLNSIVEDDQSVSTDMRTWVNSAIKLVAKRYPWDALFRTKSLTVSSSDNGVITAPALMQRLNRILLDGGAPNKHNEFHRKAQLPVVRGMRELPRWYITLGANRTAGTDFTVDVTEGSQTVERDTTEASWLTSYCGS